MTGCGFAVWAKANDDVVQDATNSLRLSTASEYRECLGRAILPIALSNLETQTQCELDLTIRALCRSDGTRSPNSNCGVRKPELRMVKAVEELGSELQFA